MTKLRQSSISPIQRDKESSRWFMLALICIGVVLCMTTWFSATAITPELGQV
jgi:hypothetical protein